MLQIDTAVLKAKGSAHQRLFLNLKRTSSLNKTSLEDAEQRGSFLQPREMLACMRRIEVTPRQGMNRLPVELSVLLYLINQLMASKKYTKYRKKTPNSLFSVSRSCWCAVPPRAAATAGAHLTQYLLCLLACLHFAKLKIVLI